MSKNAKMTNPMKVITGPNTRWSYANVWEPKSINGGTPKYSVSLIIPKSDTKTVANPIKINSNTAGGRDFSAACFVERTISWKHSVLILRPTVMCLFKKQASIVMWSLPILKSYSLPIAQTASPFGSLTLPAENRFQKKFFLPWRMNLSSSGHELYCCSFRSGI